MNQEGLEDIGRGLIYLFLPYYPERVV